MDGRRGCGRWKGGFRGVGCRDGNGPNGDDRDVTQGLRWEELWSKAGVGRSTGGNRHVTG